MNDAIAIANCIKAMESELIELRAICKKQKEEIEKYRTKEVLETLSMQSVEEILIGTLEEIMDDE